jgi:hypothetical protein
LRQDGSNSALALGSEGTPSLKWDANTGIFSPGEDQLAIVTGANRAITCTSTQAVGIKTANPNAALHVAGSTRVGADSAADAFLEIGEGATGNRNSYIDIVADTTYTDYGLRVIRNNTGANATSELKHRGTGALNFTTEEAAPIVFNTTNSPRATIDTSGRLLVGTSTARTLLSQSMGIQIETTDYPACGLSIINNQNADANPLLLIGKSRGATLNSNTIVQSGDTLGEIHFLGADGSAMLRAASIRCLVDGTPGANDMPSRLVFSTTADGASSPTERMRIDSAGTTYFLSTANTIGALTTVGAGTSTRLYYGSHSASGISGTISYTVWSNGNVVNTNNSYGSISDIKLKENIVDAGSQWGDLKALQVRKYNLKAETGQETHTQIGLVAQEVELVSPGLVSETPDRDKDGNDLGTVTKSVTYSVLYMKAVKALQEAMERIEQLEQRLTDAGIA